MYLTHDDEDAISHHQYEVAARQNLVSVLARNHEAQNCNVQVQVGQLEREADARFSQRQGIVTRFSQEALEDQREILVTEVT